MTDLEDLTKLMVYLTPKALAALFAGAEVTEDTKTDTVNRALQIYAAMVQAAAKTPTRGGTGFVTNTIDDFLGDGQAYEVWIRRAQ